METPTPIPPILRPLPAEIAGERVLVRAYRPGDGPALFEAVEETREPLRVWMDWVDNIKCEADCEVYARRAEARWLAREDLAVGMWERATGRFLGGSGLHRIEWNVPALEIGYWIRSSAEGKGYVSESVRLLCSAAFDMLGANRVSIHCDVENVRSAAVARRSGFVHEGTLRNDTRTPAGELRSTHIFSMTPEDYQRTRTLMVKI